LFAQSDWKCQSRHCTAENEGKTLAVHHRVYIRGKKPWEYEDWAFLVVCEPCHAIEQEEMEQSHSALAQEPMIADMVNWVSNWDKYFIHQCYALILDISMLPEGVRSIGLEQTRNILSALDKSHQIGNVSSAQPAHQVEDEE